MVLTGLPDGWLMGFECLTEGETCGCRWRYTDGTLTIH